MANSLILGMTESGKTTIAKQLCKAYRESYGIPTLVLDPMHDPGWEADIICRTQEEFLSIIWEVKQHAVFIDESGKMIGRFDKLMEETATIGRHWGHNFHYLSQRGTQINRTVRDQCRELFLFTTAKADCKIHADEWNAPRLLEASSLPPGICLHCDKFQFFEKINVFE